ncbi:hypothetical protein [Salinispora arenicola]|uniref:hypothetical protein n=1 Tax=Salinispora arenicola TaxID=168697 RepID=UPI00036621A4|nr:hypothetical protein [Salinispora arenicola]MCN0180479.1 flavin reductase [Salinispora arenicola]
MTRTRVPHDPMRPLWRCRACGADWPCQPARLAMLVEYRGRTSALLTHLGNQLKEASDQLRQLNGNAPDGLAARFLAWTVLRDQQAPELDSSMTSAVEVMDLDVVFDALELIIRAHWGATCPRCADDGRCPQLDWADDQLARLSRREVPSRTPRSHGTTAARAATGARPPAGEPDAAERAEAHQTRPRRRDRADRRARPLASEEQTDHRH